MNQTFSQSEDTYKVFFNTLYSHLAALGELEFEGISSTASHEIYSETIESLPNDIWMYEIYLNYNPDLENIKRILENYSKNHNISIIDNKISLEKITDQDWVLFYQNELKPIEISGFFIGAYRHKDLLPIDMDGIFVEASRAFGTGHHETTALCINALRNLSKLEFTTILDIGTGTGILAFAAEKLWPKARIYGCDIEEISIRLARDNAKFNDSSVIFYTNTIQKILLPEHQNKKFDLIISNILANPLITMAQEIRSLMHKNGYIILSGFLDYQQPELLKAYNEKGFELVETIIIDPWMSMIMKIDSDKE